jgi:hypothetical protein
MAIYARDLLGIGLQASDLTLWRTGILDEHTY